MSNHQYPYTTNQEDLFTSNQQYSYTSNQEDTIIRNHQGQQSRMHNESGQVTATAAEEELPEVSQQPSRQQLTQQIQRPDTTSSNSGSYTCTCHGCPFRSQTLPVPQKHKRKVHPQTLPTTLPPTHLGRGNSQAQRHICERIHPLLGTPCNIGFTRSYDLIRHEDTIHNTQKQKMRCQFCIKGRTYSRSDALVRHMRMVHPDV